MQVKWSIGEQRLQGIVVSTVGGFDSTGKLLRTILLVQVGDRLHQVPFDAVTVVGEANVHHD